MKRHPRDKRCFPRLGMQLNIWNLLLQWQRKQKAGMRLLISIEGLPSCTLVTKIKLPISILLVQNKPLPLISDFLILKLPTNSQSSGQIPKNPHETQLEISKLPVLDKFSINPFKTSKFPLHWDSKTKALFRQSKAKEYRLRLSKILPLQTRVFKWVLSI